MTIRTYRNAFRHLTRDLVRRHPQPDRCRNSECFAIGIPMMVFDQRKSASPQLMHLADFLLALMKSKARLRRALSRVDLAIN
jgi:hypothetical protein